MTPIMLQDDLVEEMKILTSEMTFKKMGSEERVKIQVFPQDLPVPESDDDEDPIPYIIVRLNSGSDSGAFDSMNIVKLVVIIGIWDDALDSQGYRDVLNIIQKTYQRFRKNPNLNNRSVYNGEFKWSVQEDGYYPYFFGAAELNFEIPAIRREDPFA